MAKFFKVIMNILIILFIASLAALFVPPLLGITTVVVEPEIESNLSVGSVAYGTRVSISDLYVGDSIISNTEDSTYIYDISAIDAETGELTVTVSQDAEPEQISLRRTASKKLFIIPFIGYIMIALHSTEGMIILALCVALLVILFIISEILCRRSYAKEEDEEEAYEQDREYFRGLAASQDRPSSLDELGTITIPPVADLMEEEKSSSENDNIALDEDFESPNELIIEQIEEVPEDNAEASDKQNSSDKPAPDKTSDKSDDSNKKDKTPDKAYEKESVRETKQDIDTDDIETPDADDINSAVSHPADTINDASEISGLTSALESALENEQMNQTPRTSQSSEPITKEEQTVQPEEIELAIPIHTVDELLQEAYSKGEDPKVVKDDITGITFVDYSNCL